MSVKVEALPAIPEQTVEVARAAFPGGNRFMQIRDHLGTLYTDEDFVDLYSTQGQPGVSPWRVALLLIFAYMEDLSDRRAVEALRSRIDWKYALSLELSDSGFDAAVLSEFRSRLVEGGATERLFERLLASCQEAGYVKARGRQRTDATHVLAAVRSTNRLVFLGETLRHALNVLATSAPAWLQPRLRPGWLERYEKRMDDYHLPKAKAKRQALTLQIGEDGRTLLHALFAPESPRWLRELPAVRTLQRVWLEQFQAVPPDQPLALRSATEQPPAGQRLHSPYDVDARYASKRQTSWLGYKAHFTESCDDDLPHLILDVQTTPATTPDFDMAQPIQEALAAKALLPAEHLLDAGYVDGALLVQSQQRYGIDVVGPVAPDHSWQAQTEGAHELSTFSIDWAEQVVTCPPRPSQSQMVADPRRPRTAHH